MTGALRRGKFGHRHVHKKNTCKHKGRDCGVVSRNQGISKIVSYPTEVREEAWNRFSVRQLNFCCLSHVIDSALLGLPQQTNKPQKQIQHKRRIRQHSNNGPLSSVFLPFINRFLLMNYFKKNNLIPVRHLAKHFQTRGKQK